MERATGEKREKRVVARQEWASEREGESIKKSSLLRLQLRDAYVYIYVYI